MARSFEPANHDGLSRTGGRPGRIHGASSVMVCGPVFRASLHKEKALSIRAGFISFRFREDSAARMHLFIFGGIRNVVNPSSTPLSTQYATVCYEKTVCGDRIQTQDITRHFGDLGGDSNPHHTCIRAALSFKLPRLPTVLPLSTAAVY